MNPLALNAVDGTGTGAAGVVAGATAQVVTAVVWMTVAAVVWMTVTAAQAVTAVTVQMVNAAGGIAMVTLSASSTALRAVPMTSLILSTIWLHQCQ